MNGQNGPTPIEDYLDELLRHTHADPRTTRRLLDEAGDHLVAAANELQVAGMPRVEAEREAVRRFGSADELLHGCWRRSFGALISETLRAAILLGGCGLVAVGLSGGVVAVMNALAGPSFVGGATVLDTGGSTVAETAHDAVALRTFAGVVGLLILAGYAVLRRYTKPATVLPGGLVDALGAAAFAAAAVVLIGASLDQAVTGVGGLGGHGVGGLGGHGVGFFLSGAVVSLAATVLFCARATRALLSSHLAPPAGLPDR
jgi:hypothetical protein